MSEQLRPTPETDQILTELALGNIGLAAANEKIGGIERERDKAMEALKPFAHYLIVMSAMGGTTPKSGAIWGCHSKAGDAEITVEDLRLAQSVLTQTAVEKFQ